MKISVKLFNDDCFNIFPQIPDNSIDLVLCDLPYAETGNDWDKHPINLEKLFEQYRRIIKEDG